MINWWGWLNTHSGCKSLSCISPDSINWRGWLNTHPAGESLQWLTRSNQLTRLAEHPSSKWVTLYLINWQGWLKTHPGSEFFPSVCPDLINWWEHWSRMWVALQCLTRSNQLTRLQPSIQWVSALQCLADLQSLTRLAEHPWSGWVALQCRIKSNHLTRLAEHPSSLWVTLHCLSRSNQLMRPRKWVNLQCSTWFADKVDLTPIQQVSVTTS